jgi:ribosomal protein L11 methyltransferase
VSETCWKIELRVPGAAVDQLAAAIEPYGGALSYFEVPGSSDWTVEAYAPGMPDRAALGAAVAAAAAAAGIAVPEVQCGPLPDIDWLAENRRSFKPIAIGRYFVHPTHYDGAVPANARVIMLDAATAFGSGEHETTRGCLSLLGRLGRRMRPGRVLDLGCGSGILSIAAAKTWPCRVTAADIDPESVRVCSENVVRNGVAGRVMVTESDGLRAAAIRRHGPYDVVLANILAGPLIRLAPALSRSVARPGLLILSGLLAEQVPGVLAAYRRQGLRPIARQRYGEWPSVLLQKPF